MTIRKSRTLSLSDEDWETITKASEDFGFGKNNRGRFLVFLVKEHNKRIEQEQAARDSF